METPYLSRGIHRCVHGDRQHDGLAERTYGDAVARRARANRRGLIDGTVLVTGPDYTAELFSPGTGTFSVVGELSTRFGATATLRNDGTVLVAGGRNRNSLATAQLFAPESGGFVATGSLITARDGHTATRLLDGTVLVTGGTQHTCVGIPWSHGCGAKSLVLSSAELFK